MDPKAVKPAAPITAMPGACRPEDALKRLHEALANEHPTGIIVATVSENGDVDVRVYGIFTLQQVLWAGAVLQNEALDG